MRIDGVRVHEMAMSNKYLGEGEYFGMGRTLTVRIEALHVPGEERKSQNAS
jgi:hypothetical protein